MKSRGNGQQSLPIRSTATDSESISRNTIRSNAGIRKQLYRPILFLTVAVCLFLMGLSVLSWNIIVIERSSDIGWNPMKRNHRPYHELPEDEKRHQRAYAAVANSAATASDVDVVTDNDTDRNVQLWYVLHPRGVTVDKVRPSSTASASLGMLLPMGAVLIADELYVDSHAILLHVSFPTKGWIIASAADGVAPHVQPLHINTLEDRAHPTAGLGAGVGEIANQGSTTVSQPVAVYAQCQNASAFKLNYDFKGGDLKVVSARSSNSGSRQPHGLRSNPMKARSPHDCCDQCVRAARYGCEHWTFVAKSSDCWLKGHVSELRRVTEGAAMISGQITSNHTFSRRTTQQHMHSDDNKLPIPSSSSPCCSMPSEPHSLQIPVECFGFNLDLKSTCSASFSDSWARNTLLCSNTTVWRYDDSAVVQKSANLQYSCPSFLEPVEVHHRADAINQRSLLHRRLQNSDNFATTSLLQLHRLYGDWLDQQPVGNGLFGGLVGGTIQSEVVPLSIAGLYFRKSINEKISKARDDTAAIRASSTFKAAREAMKLHNFREAEKKMSSLQKGNQAMFQYLADLIFIFSPSSIMARPESAAVSLEQKGKKVGTDRARTKKMSIKSRREQLRRSLTQRLMYRSNKKVNEPDQEQHLSTGYIADAPFCSLYQSDGALDWRNGLAHSFFVYSHSGLQPCNSISERSRAYVVQHREWFVSEFDNVMAGTFTCHGINNTAYDNCLHFAMQLGRSSAVGMEPNVSVEWIDVEQSPLGDANVEDYFGDLNADENVVLRKAFQLQLHASISVHVPSTKLYGILFCIGHASSTDPTRLFSLRMNTSTAAAIVCSEAYRSHVLLSIGTEANTFTGYDDTVSHDPESSVAAALALSLPSLRQRHMELFSQRMDRVHLHLGNYLPQINSSILPHQVEPMNPDVCPVTHLANRLESFGEHCVYPFTVSVNFTSSGNYSSHPSDTRSAQSKQTDTMTDYDQELLHSMYQFGRYLAFSSGTRAAMNLQGIWADGPTSAWNGDYHLNINMQMNYWAMDTAGLKEIADPLQHFIEELSTKGGQLAAYEMYGCRDERAWVAHGFTDDTLYGGLFGDPHWALCVTCGAWLATHLFEHALMRPTNLQELQEKLLPIFRGIAVFFQEYMLITPSSNTSSSIEMNVEGRGSGNYIAHTGPASSPETTLKIRYRDAIPQPTAAPVVLPPSSRSHGNTAPQRNANHRKRSAPSELYTPVVWSPAIDISILRQCASIFYILLQWIEQDVDDTSRILLEADKKLANSFFELVTHMPGKAVPMIDQSNGLIREFPAPASPHHFAIDHDHVNVRGAARRLSTSASIMDQLFGRHPSANLAKTLSDRSSQLPSAIHPQEILEKDIPTQFHSDEFNISEDFDFGHRHFSGLHWLYPNAFLPYTTDSEDTNLMKQQLMEAGKRTLHTKLEHGGGHTSWSAAWAACLAARLGDGETAFAAVANLLSRFTASNLLSLHPPLDKIGSELCPTSFIESKRATQMRTVRKRLRREQIFQSATAPHRDQRGNLHFLYLEPLNSEELQRENGFRNTLESGMLTESGEKFQIDGNFGYLAAMNEMLIQSHIPGLLQLLPAMSSHLLQRHQASAFGLHARGDLLVSLAWNAGKLTTAVVIFNSPHPWLKEVKEDPYHSGFYSMSMPQRRNIIKVTVETPNEMAFYDHPFANLPRSCVGMISDNIAQSRYGMYRTSWTIQNGSNELFPCSAILCSSLLSGYKCSAVINAVAEHYRRTQR